MNCDLCLRKLSQVHRTVPPLSTPSLEQSPASVSTPVLATCPPTCSGEAGARTGSGSSSLRALGEPCKPESLMSLVWAGVWAMRAVLRPRWLSVLLSHVHSMRFQTQWPEVRLFSWVWERSFIQLEGKKNGAGLQRPGFLCTLFLSFSLDNLLNL